MSEIKNICFAYITPFHPSRGGIGRATHSLTLELRNRGYNVFYLIYPSSITLRHEFDYPAPLEYLPSGDCLSDENVNYYFDYLRRNRIDVVINQSGNFSDSKLWCKAKEIGVKVISVLHSNPGVSYNNLWSTDIWPLRSSGLKERLKRVARVVLYQRIKKRVYNDRVGQFSFLLPATDRVCLLSANYFDELSAFVPGYENKYCAIPNPNAPELDMGASVQPTRKEKTLLFVGLFSPPKKEELVLKLWKRIYKDFPDWNLVIVGDGPAYRVDRLKRIAATTDRVTFAGMVPSAEYHKKASILVMTSGYEGWPMVLTEAMQCGTVPIAFNSFAAVTEMVSDGTDGILVKPFDLDEYERKLRRLMADDAMRAEMSANAVESVKRFDISNIADRWENLFRSLK